jgi:hypothetical protein
MLPAEARISLFATTCIMALGHTKAPIHWQLNRVSMDVNQPELEANSNFVPILRTHGTSLPFLLFSFML